MRRGHSCIAVNLEPVFASIDQYAPIIDAAVRAAYQATGCAPLLVGHSMGGLAIRAWQRTSAGGAHRAFHTVTIGSPHHGTWLGRFSHVKNGKQMRFQSPWLMQLTADEASAREKLGIIGHDHGLSPRVTCWYSNSDNIVLPASSATLAYADNRLVRGVAHLALAFHPPIIDHCLHLLEHAEPPSKLTKSTTPPCR